MLASAELAIQIANTRAFIAANPTSLILIPRVRQMDGNGYRLVDQDARPAQTLRVIDQATSRNVFPGMIQTSDGRERLIDYILLGMPDAMIELWDYWVDAEGTYEVAQMYGVAGQPSQYETRAAVVKRA